MIGKNFVSRLAIAPPRRGLVTAVIYGLSLAVRFTSAVGEDAEIPPPSANGPHPLISILRSDRSELPYQNWGHKLVRPMVLRQGWPPSLQPSGCIAP